MRTEGHVGFSLLVLSLSAIVFRWLSFDFIVASLAVAIFSSLPDMDLYLSPFGVKHRGITHTIIFGLLSGLAFGLLSWRAGYGLTFGFTAAFGGALLHIFGDVMSREKMKPFAPFLGYKMGFGLFSAGNKLVNKALGILGCLAFTFVALKYFGFV